MNGLSLYYEIHGSGEPLVLLHGGWAASMGSGARCCRPWARGGASSPESYRATIIPAYLDALMENEEPNV